MAHELTINGKGQAEMFYAGERPWHGLGQKLDGPATASDAIIAANLNWDVAKRELLYPTTAGGERIVPKTKAVVRTDNDKVLGIVGDRYVPVQNFEAFAFFDAVVGTGAAIYETAGSLFGGRKIFLSAKLPDVVRITSEDIVEKYITLINGHDGHIPVIGFISPIRPVCNNTVLAALRNARNKFTIRHVGNMADKIKMAQDALGLTRKYFAEYQDIASALRDRLVTAAEVERIIEASLKITDKEKAEDDVSTQKEKTSARIKTLFTDDEKNNLPGIKGSAWSLYNAVAQYADHESGPVSKGADMRMNSILFGVAAELKLRAWAASMALVK